MNKSFFPFIFLLQDSILLPIKEDLSEWITRIVGVEINPDSFMDILDSGVVLCSISKLIEKHAKAYAAEGKLTEVCKVFEFIDFEMCNG